MPRWEHDLHAATLPDRPQDARAAGAVGSPTGRRPKNPERASRTARDHTGGCLATTRSALGDSDRDTLGQPPDRAQQVPDPIVRPYEQRVVGDDRNTDHENDHPPILPPPLGPPPRAVAMALYPWESSVSMISSRVAGTPASRQQRSIASIARSIVSR